MSTTTITEGQSLLDVALQELGDLAALFDLADATGLAITDALAPGQVLTVPASAAGRPELVGYFAGRAYRVNTGAEPAPPSLREADFLPADFLPTDFLTPA